MRTLIRNTVGWLLILGTIMGTTSVAVARHHQKCGPQKTIHLEGFTRFAVYSVGEQKELLSPSDWYLYCSATLTYTSKRTFELVAAEYMNDGDIEPMRTRYISGKIRKNGELWFDLDGLDEVQLHTGVTAFGMKPNQIKVRYEGYLEDGSLYLVAYIMGRQTQPAEFPMYWKDPADPTILYKGPITFRFTYELDVVE